MNPNPALGSLKPSYQAPPGPVLCSQPLKAKEDLAQLAQLQVRPGGPGWRAQAPGHEAVPLGTWELPLPGTGDDLAPL